MGISGVYDSEGVDNILEAVQLSESKTGRGSIRSDLASDNEYGQPRSWSRLYDPRFEAVQTPEHNEGKR